MDRFVLYILPPSVNYILCLMLFFLGLTICERIISLID